MSDAPACLIFGLENGEFHVAIEREPFRGEVDDAGWLVDAEAFGPFKSGNDAGFWLNMTHPAIISYRFAPFGYYQHRDEIAAVAARSEAVEVPDVSRPFSI